MGELAVGEVVGEVVGLVPGFVGENNHGPEGVGNRLVGAGGVAQRGQPDGGMSAPAVADRLDAPRVSQCQLGRRPAATAGPAAKPG